MSGLVRVRSGVTARNEDVHPSGSESQELLMLRRDLAGRPAKERLAQSQADRQLPHPGLARQVGDDPIEGAVKVDEPKRAGAVDSDLCAGGDGARPFDIERLLALRRRERTAVDVDL